MKIFHVITLSTLGGAQSVVVNLANNQILNNEVYILFGGRGEAWRTLNPKIRLIKIPELKRNVNWLDLFVLFKLFFYYLIYLPDVVHLHSSKIGILGRVAFPSSKIIYTVHGFDSIRLKYRKYLFLERKLQYKCKYIVSVSEYDLKNLYNEGIFNHVKCIYNGISNLSTSTCDAQLNIDRNKYRRIVLCIARMAPPKRSDLFLSVAKLLPEYAFVWIGNYDDVIDAPNNTFFLGNVLEAFRYNKLTDLFFLPSDFEGLPMTIIEAMSFGKPIVASNVGGISEIVMNNQNGFVVDNCVQDFVEKIKYILEDEFVYQRLSGKSMEIYNKLLNAQKMCDEYVTLYKA